MQELNILVFETEMKHWELNLLDNNANNSL